MTTYRLRIETEPANADVKFLLDSLYRYNVERTGRDDGQWLAILLRDEMDHIVAGLYVRRQAWRRPRRPGSGGGGGG
jgi:hypothetical protein